MKWKIVKNDYNMEVHLVDDDTHQIIGEVSGSKFDPSNGWCALDRRVSPPKFIGMYDTCEAAEVATERAVRP